MFTISPEVKTGTVFVYFFILSLLSNFQLSFSLSSYLSVFVQKNKWLEMHLRFTSYFCISGSKEGIGGWEE